MSGIAHGMDAATQQNRDNKPKMCVEHPTHVQVSLSTVP